MQVVVACRCLLVLRGAALVDLGSELLDFSAFFVELVEILAAGVLAVVLLSGEQIHLLLYFLSAALYLVL